MTRKECLDRGWDEVDIVFVTGDAYVDHPSFAMALLGRVLEAAGFRVAILSQPDWHSCRAWSQFGRPRLFFAVSAGNMDSMINHYTANKKVRNDDAYSPGGEIKLRPDRATLSYCQRAREAYKGVPVIAGGVEASLRRLAHYDHWSETVRRSIVMDSKCDLLVYGMGEAPILEIARRLQAGETVKDLRDMRGVAYALGQKEDVPTDAITLPSYEEVKADHVAFARASGIFHTETNPFNAKTLLQFHGKRAVVQRPPTLPISETMMDELYDLPYTRKSHPSYTEEIPAFEMIKDSVTIMRGCFGGCTFCSITAHQGRIVQNRSKQSVLKELKKMGRDKSFKGTVSDIGGPTANMYRMRCSKPEVEKQCKKPSCVHPKICKLLDTDCNDLIDLMQASRTVAGVKRVMVTSGVRMDLANLSPKYIKELSAHHVSGRLKVAPEHVSLRVLEAMKKPSIGGFTQFKQSFDKASKSAGKPLQYLVPYYISSHPGSDIDDMIEMAVYNKQHGLEPDQVQDFIPAPLDVATTMYYTGIDPLTMQPIYTAKKMNDRLKQRALMQYFKPENYFEVRSILKNAKRSDLIGDGSNCLISANPSREARDIKDGKATIARRAKKEMQELEDLHHRITKKSKGYRPNRKSHRRR